MYTTILAPLDGSELSERALPIAISLAQATGAKLVLVRATSSPVPPGIDTPEPERKEVEQAGAYLADIADRIKAHGVEVETAVQFAEPAEGIAIETRAHKADIIVMCTHGRSGLGRWFFGSVAERVLTQTTVPVLLVRPVGDATLQPLERGKLKIVVPLDGTPSAEAALSEATELARLFAAPLLLLRVLVPMSPGLSVGFMFMSPSLADQLGEEATKEEQAAKDYLARVAEKLRNEGLTVQTRVRPGDEPETITIEARASGAQLVVMATHERTRLGGLLLGRVAMGVLRQGTLPVLLAPPQAAGEAALAGEGAHSEIVQ